MDEREGDGILDDRGRHEKWECGEHMKDVMKLPSEDSLVWASNRTLFLDTCPLRCVLKPRGGASLTSPRFSAGSGHASTVLRRQVLSVKALQMPLRLDTCALRLCDSYTSFTIVEGAGNGDPNELHPHLREARRHTTRGP